MNLTKTPSRIHEQLAGPRGKEGLRLGGILHAQKQASQLTVSPQEGAHLLGSFCLASPALRLSGKLRVKDQLVHFATPTPTPALTFRHSLGIWRKMLTQLLLSSSQHLRLQGVSTAGRPLEKPITSKGPFADSSDCLPSLSSHRDETWGSVARP